MLEKRIARGFNSRWRFIWWLTSTLHNDLVSVFFELLSRCSLQNSFFSGFKWFFRLRRIFFNALTLTTSATTLFDHDFWSTGARDSIKERLLLFYTRWFGIPKYIKWGRLINVDIVKFRFGCWTFLDALKSTTYLNERKRPFRLLLQLVKTFNVGCFYVLWHSFSHCLVAWLIYWTLQELHVDSVYYFLWLDNPLVLVSNFDRSLISGSCCIISRLKVYSKRRAFVYALRELVDVFVIGIRIIRVEWILVISGLFLSFLRLWLLDVFGICGPQSKVFHRLLVTQSIIR